jgi:cyanophycinase
MTGTLALVGGGEFELTEELDRELLERADGAGPLILPTADAFEHPERAVARGEAWFAGLGATARGLPVLRRPDAFSPDHVAAIRASRFTYLVGDSPMHLRSVLKDTPLWEALVAAEADGGVVAASGAAAMALCDPMTDPRGGAFTLGLGFARPMAVVPGAEGWSHDRLHRTLGLGLAFPVVTLATGAAVVREPAGWRAHGEAVVHLAGAAVDVDALPAAP